MTWLQACSESQSHTAVRNWGEGRVMLRSQRGNGVLETESGTVRPAHPQELEGHTDWQPLGGEEEIRPDA